MGPKVDVLVPPLAIGKIPDTSAVKLTVEVPQVPAVILAKPVQPEVSWPVPPY